MMLTAAFKRFFLLRETSVCSLGNYSVKTYQILDRRQVTTRHRIMLQRRHQQALSSQQSSFQSRQTYSRSLLHVLYITIEVYAVLCFLQTSCIVFIPAAAFLICSPFSVYSSHFSIHGISPGIFYSYVVLTSHKTCTP